MLTLSQQSRVSQDFSNHRHFFFFFNLPLLLLFACFGGELKNPRTKETVFSLYTSTHKSSTFHALDTWWFLKKVRWGDEQLHKKQMPWREQAVLWIRSSGLNRECWRQGFVQQTGEEKPDQL